MFLIQAPLNFSPEQDKDASFPSLRWHFEMDSVFTFIEKITLDVLDSKSNTLLHECMPCFECMHVKALMRSCLFF
jgi:hypothetical protein